MEVEYLEKKYLCFCSDGYNTLEVAWPAEFELNNLAGSLIGRLFSWRA